MNPLISFEKNCWIHLTVPNISYNIKIAQIAHDNFLKSVAIVQEQVGGIRRKVRE